MASALERIRSELQALNPDERQRLREHLERDWTAPRRSAAAALVEQVRGKYAFVPTSSEAFAARKAKDLEMENRRDSAP